jgi:hypothetical protein
LTIVCFPPATLIISTLQIFKEQLLQPQSQTQRINDEQGLMACALVEVLGLSPMTTLAAGRPVARCATQSMNNSPLGPRAKVSGGG